MPLLVQMEEYYVIQAEPGKFLHYEWILDPHRGMVLKLGTFEQPYYASRATRKSFNKETFKTIKQLFPNALLIKIRTDYVILERHGDL